MANKRPADPGQPDTQALTTVLSASRTMKNKTNKTLLKKKKQ